MEASDGVDERQALEKERKELLSTDYISREEKDLESLHCTNNISLLLFFPEICEPQRRHNRDEYDVQNATRIENDKLIYLILL